MPGPFHPAPPDPASPPQGRPALEPNGLRLGGQRPGRHHHTGTTSYSASMGGQEASLVRQMGCRLCSTGGPCILPSGIRQLSGWSLLSFLLKVICWPGKDSGLSRAVRLRWPRGLIGWVYLAGCNLAELGRWRLPNPCRPIESHVPLRSLLLVFQLLNQFENTGPPPADKEKIQALPTVPVTEEHVGMLTGWWTESPGTSLLWHDSQWPASSAGSGLECPVCKDDYALGESVRQLPCNHLFHDSCIVPWLEQVTLPCPPT